ncbi:PREDICTED: chymotrypsinogen A-like [Rhagoletis zephyria]|uniref:chymotrypsinogen A-like n=1 Tax=Rhagoletis zephyria TaxID=28612 RepID=UPI00081183B9|nr:PREDICTED: chymotrypsinogen A-like [Rhagoletis zephyria]
MKFFLWLPVLAVCFCSASAKVGNDPLCGSKGPPTNPDGRIVGGEVAEPHEYPWMASFQAYKPSEGRLTHNCGASILNDRWIITAAHCGVIMGGIRPTIVVGSYNLTSTGPLESARQSLSIEKFITHPNFSSSHDYLANDIALIRLATPIANLSTAPQLGSICVPEKAKNAGNEFVDSIATASGWGVTFSGSATPHDVLMKVFLPMVAVKECAEVFQTSEEDTKTMLCAFAKGKDTCQGDSGGPIALKIDQKWTVIGLTSFGRGCGGSTPGVYSRVALFSDWIWETIGQYKNGNEENGNQSS